MAMKVGARRSALWMCWIGPIRSISAFRTGYRSAEQDRGQVYRRDRA